MCTKTEAEAVICQVLEEAAEKERQLSQQLRELKSIIETHEQDLEVAICMRVHVYNACVFSLCMHIYIYIYIYICFCVRLYSCVFLYAT
jgi:hypothetical protein